MMKTHKFKRVVITIILILFSSIVGFMESSCKKRDSQELYHRFSEKSWARFNLLQFEIPVKKVGSYNIYLFARFSPGFQHETLNFNMIMNTPSGEERIHEYQMDVKSKSGSFCIECSKDSCTGTILLKREINLNKPGILKIEIENLTPRLIAEGVLGVGIRMEPSGK